MCCPFVIKMDGAYLYNLINTRAGSKMLYQALEVMTYMRIQDYLIEEGPDSVELAEEEYKNFQNHSYSVKCSQNPMKPFTAKEVETFTDEAIANIPWVAVHMLETLCAGEAEAIIDKRLKDSVANKWRIPRPDDVAMKDSFDYIYNKWTSENSFWIQKFNDSFSGHSS